MSRIWASRFLATLTAVATVGVGLPVVAHAAPDPRGSVPRAAGLPFPLPVPPPAAPLTYVPLKPKLRNPATWNPRVYDPTIVHLLSPAESGTTSVVVPKPAVLKLSQSVDLRGYAEPVGNQGDVSSCVGWATGYGMAGWWANRQHRMSAADWFNPMSLYAPIANYKNVGTYPSNAMIRLGGVGITRAKDYSVDAYTYWHKPTPKEVLAGTAYRLTGTHTLFAVKSWGGGSAGASAIAQQLSQGRPVAISVRVFNTLLGANKGGFYDVGLSAWPRYVGNHEMLAVGYNQQGLLVQNSWGTGWGNNGYIRIGWKYVQGYVYQAHYAEGMSAG